MFDGLSNKLGGIFDRLKKRGSLSEADVTAAMREIRIALLEADVALPVAKDFIAKATERAVGQDVLKSITPGQQVVKIVNDTMVDMLGGTESEPVKLLTSPPTPILMVGLQGSGKTTTSAKLALRFKDKERKKVLMASLDVARPAAQEQLAQLGTQIGVDTLEIVKGQSPLDITDRAMKKAKTEAYDVVILDTAGRLSIDDALMEEVAAVKARTKPSETLLIADAMTGQDAVNTAKNFEDRIGLTGIILTRIDGDTRGGAALSMHAVTGKPIKMLGTGEKTHELEVFHPDRIVSRILDMGDIVSLVERAAENVDQEEAEKMAAKMAKGQFDLADYLSQLRQMQKMGGMGGIMNMLPGMGKMKEAMAGANVDESIFTKQEAIILSMTKKERQYPKLLNASRKKRVAAGSGSSVEAVNRLLKQHQQMQKMMKKLRKLGKKGLMRQGLGSLMGGGSSNNFLN